jgi:diaminohydroxyphosphoribosylaminopyrimidine deaminase/5-amino-6-(5-phosphoribosylamino)uracil reductase
VTIHGAERQRSSRGEGADRLAVALTASQSGAAADAAWTLVQFAADTTDQLEQDGTPRTFAEGDALQVVRAAEVDDPRAVLTWNAAEGWRSLLSSDDPRSGLLELYLPICSASARRPLTIGHLGQSLDGFIATRSGDSRFVTGDDNMIHMHRLRALCEAIVVGAGTVAVDDPQLTTRRVPGRSPIRVIVDPQRRLAPTARVFVDEAAPTLYCCGRSTVRAGETHVGAASIIAMDESGDGSSSLAEIVAQLRAQGCARVFVEGGGVTVSAFLEANLLDRLQIAVAPMLIGDGRPAIRLTPPNRLGDCRRPSCRVFTMGSDILFDCDLRADASAKGAGGSPVTRVI